MTSDHGNGWPFIWVVLNTLFTALGAVFGATALVIALIALFRG